MTGKSGGHDASEGKTKSSAGGENEINEGRCAVASMTGALTCGRSLGDL